MTLEQNRIREYEESLAGLSFVESPEERFSTGLVLPRDMSSESRAAVQELIDFVPMEEVVGTEEAEYGRAFWGYDAFCGDQNGYSSCTGGAARNLLNTQPYKHDYPESLMYYLYDMASRNDPWEGHFDSTTMTQYGEGGSSMQAVARALVQLGYAATFAVTYEIDTMARWLINHGPGLLGMPWGGCFRVDEKGYVHPDGTDGGHATCVRSIVRSWEPEEQVGPDRIRGINQWAEEWGLRGDYRMTLEELAGVPFTFICIAEVKKA